MQTVRITTTQNVEIEYEIASIGERILAALIDYGVVIGYGLAISVILSALAGSGSRLASPAVVIILLLPIFFYDLVCEILMDGQSFGKKQMKIKVTMLDGSQPGIRAYLLRWLLRLVDVTLSWGSVAILTLLFNGKGQRLGDLAAGTTVIKLKPEVGLRDTIFAEIEKDYQPVFPQVAELNDKDIALVKEVLNAGLEVEDTRVGDKLEQKAKTVLARKMGITTNMHPRAFLSTVLKDYNYFKGKV
jgi:uncharacterized RDD family membrane protein YckC